MKNQTKQPRMHLKTIALLLGGATFFGFIGTKADAFFGPVCIPRLSNCMCTFIMPCPVIDAGSIVTTGVWKELLKDQKEDVKDMTEGFTKMNNNLACNSSGGIPGLNAMGLDVNAILRSKIPNVNLGTLQVRRLDQIRDRLEQASMGRDALQRVLSGEMTSEDFLSAAQSAGLSVPDLSAMGISPATLSSLAAGDMSKIIQSGLSRVDTQLQNLGMVSDPLQKLATGRLDVDSFLQQAQSAGISQSVLADMGINPNVLHSFSSGNISQLGIPGLDPLAAAGPKISLNADQLQRMLAGDDSPQRILAMAREAGLSPSTLQTMGVSPQTIASLREGAMSPQQLLEVSGALNIKDKALASLGINKELIENISLGRIAPEALTNIAQGAGLSLPDMQGLGLDPSSLRDMINRGPEALMGTLQGAGMGNPILANLGIDAEMIGRIASGQLPAEEVSRLLRGAGIPDGAIVIPGLEGAISVIEGAEDQVDAITDRFQDMVNLPIPSIPGLGGLLGSCGSGVDPEISAGGGIGDGSETPEDPAPNPEDAATDTGGGGGTGTTQDLAGGIGGGAACLPNQPLISNRQPPSDFSADVATLDYAFAGSEDIFVQQETMAEAAAYLPDVYANAKARSIVFRPLLVEALDSIRGIEEQMALIDTNGTPEEAWRMNSAIKTHSIAAMAEIASLGTYLTTVQAALQVSPRTYTALPIFPHDSQWQQQFQETTGQESIERREVAEEELAAMTAYNTYHYQARALFEAHEMARQYNVSASHIPALTQTARLHEQHKEMVYYMEAPLKAALTDLYVDPDRAWNILQADLRANAGEYTDQDKWTTSEQRANTISAMLTADTPTTRYGRRIMTRAESTSNSSGGRETIPAVYSSTPTMPFSYPYVNERIDGEDPMQISPPVGDTQSNSGGREGTTVVIPRMTGGLQTYMEATRRESHWATIRRGSDSHTTSGAAWSELLDNAPECLQGPMETNAVNLAQRPDMFDINPSCDHLVWENGDAEDYIASTEFGGADAILWQTKIDMNQTLLQAGANGPRDLQPAIARKAQMVAATERDNNIEQRLRGVQYISAANHVQEMRRMAQTIENDTALQARVTFPRIRP